MNKTDAYNHGLDRGIEVALHCEEEEETEEEEVEWCALSVADKRNACLESELHSRQYSPFEFFASDVNECGDRAEGLWDSYDAGVVKGINGTLAGHQIHWRK